MMASITKTLRNQKGVSLVEVLAVLVITTFLTGVAIFVFQSLSTSTYASTEGRNAQQEAKFALSQIANALHDSNKVMVPDLDELRFTSFVNDHTAAYKAVYFVREASGTQGTLWIANFIGSESQWQNTAINHSTHPSLYANNMALAQGLTQTPTYTNGDGSAITGTLTGGSTLKLTLSYQLKRKTASGGIMNGNVRTVQTSVKLYKDGS
ncbi:PilW family protein [Paenibacillus sp. SI8]|uniref:PilW family protein n=1 Tax=unclassified Paenibacillus TaxID=185978 RepID=UPI003465A84B